MAPNLRETLETIRDEDEAYSGGGSIGITIYNPDTGEDEKVWLDENEAISLLNDKDTKEAFLKAIQPGRGTAEQERYKAEMWSWDRDIELHGKNWKGQGKKPEMPEVVEELPLKPVDKPLEIAPPGDESEGPQEKVPDYFEAPPSDYDGPNYFASPADVMSKEYDEFDDTREKPDIPPEPPDEVKKAAAADPELEANRKIIRRGGDDPYTRKPKQVEITPQNYIELQQKSTEIFQDYIDNKYGFVPRIDAEEAARREIERQKAEWFLGLAKEEGFRNLEISLLDQYKRSKDPRMIKFIDDWESYYTKNAERTHKNARDKLGKLLSTRDREIVNFQLEWAKKVKEMKVMEEEARNAEGDRIKLLDAYTKAQKELRDAMEEDEKFAIRAAKAKIALFGRKLGIKDDPAEKVLTPEEQARKDVEAQWGKDGLSPEQIEYNRKRVEVLSGQGA